LTNSRKPECGAAQRSPLEIVPDGLALRVAPFARLTSGRAASAAFARSHRTRFIDHQRAAHQVLTMAVIDRALRHGVICNLDETESASLPRKTVTHYSDAIDRYAILGKEVL
jgi:hypothetical protein